MSIEEIVSSSIEEIIYEHLREFQTENGEIQEVRAQVNGRYLELEEIIKQREDLDELGNLIRSYDDTRNLEELLQYRHLYIAGIKDGVKLLKAVGAVETLLDK